MARSQTPSYYHHEPAGQAYLTLSKSGKREVQYLGKWGGRKFSAYSIALTEADYLTQQIEHVLQMARLATSPATGVPNRSGVCGAGRPVPE